MRYIGIDPGKTGGITVLFNNTVDLYTIPKIFKEVNIRVLEKILTFEGECHYFIEKVHAIFGASAGSTFEFGRIYGIIEGVVAGKGKPYTLVQPKEWQKEMFQGIKEIRKKGKLNKNGKVVRGRIDTKAMAAISCNRLFPDVNLYVTDKGNKSKQINDGLADALLIAEYGRRIKNN